MSMNMNLEDEMDSFFEQVPKNNENRNFDNFSKLKSSTTVSNQVPTSNKNEVRSDSIKVQTQ